MPLDPELYRRKVAVSDGTLLSAIDLRPEAPERTIVLLHGFGGAARQWVRVLQAFGHRHRCIALDLRGHGRSAKPPGDYTVGQLVRDVEDAVAALGVEKPFVLWGQSFGGALAAEYATRHPDHVDRLVLTSATGDFDKGARVALVFRLPMPVLEAVRQVVHAATRTSWNAPARVLKPMYNRSLRTWDGWPVYRRIRVPALVINGARDYLFKREALHRVAKEVPRSEHVEIAASYHNIMLDRSEAVVRAVNRFIGDEAGWRPRGRVKVERPWVAHYEDGVPPSVAVPAQPLHRILEQTAARFPRRAAVRFHGGRITYRSLVLQARRFAGALRNLGLQAGDHVYLALPNSPPAVICYYGALMAGCVAVLGNPLAPPEELARQARECGARVAVLPAALPAHAAAVEEAGVRHVLATRLGDWAGTAGKLLGKDPRVPPGKADLREALRRAAPAEPVDSDPEGVAVVAYTGGTTDASRGVMLSHRALVANTIQLRHWMPHAREGREVVLLALPVFHSYGMTAGMNLGLVLGATLVLLPRFEPAEALRTIARTRPTLLPGVPPMYNALANHPEADKRKLRSIRLCVSGAAPLPVEVQEGFERVTRARLVEGYGLTEATPVTHANPLHGRRKTGSIGLPLPGTDAMVVDLATGRRCAPGEVGELLVKGPQVMLGYWQDAAATRAAFTEDGWLRTGDMAVEDGDGYFAIVDRKKDMVEAAGGERIFPRDVEEVLYEHPMIFEAAVVGRRGSGGAAQLGAFVVLKRGETCTAEDILAFCRRRLQASLCPAWVEFREELPKSFVGKVLRRMLVAEGPPRGAGR